MRCDLHVHTIHSGMSGIPLIGRVCRESYNPPEALHETLKRRGMDLVTVTDHDSIDAAEVLRKHDDFFLSEEVTCRMPTGTELHVGVYDIDERQHQELQRRRDDLFALVAYLNEQRLFFSVNHAFSALTGQREADDFTLFWELFPALETRNGTLPRRANRYAAHLAAMTRKAQVGGSDSHTPICLGRTYTEVARARDKAEFLAGLRQRAGRVQGEAGSFYKLTRDALWVTSQLMLEHPWTRLLAPLALLIPVVTFANRINEVAFAEHWSRRILRPERRREWAERARAFAG